MEVIGLSLVSSVVGCIGQDAHLEHGDGLHLLVGGVEAVVGEVKVARLLDQALEFDGLTPVAVLFAQRGAGSLDGRTVLAGRLLLELGQDHALLE